MYFSFIESNFVYTRLIVYICILILFLSFLLIVNCEIWLWGGYCRCVMIVLFWGVLLGRFVIGGGTRNWLIWFIVLKLKFCVCGENMGRKCNLISFILKRWDGVNLMIMVYRMRGFVWFKGFCFIMKFLFILKKRFYFNLFCFWF